MNIIQKIGFSKSPEDVIFIKRIKELTGFKPKDITIYKLAFTHKSANKTDEKGEKINYERLEFLGDALLDSAITSYLFHNLPQSAEGELTQMRSKIVSRKHLNKIGKDFDLISFAKKPNSKRKFSYNAHGDFFEALIAAIYLDRGYIIMDRFIQKKLIEKYVDLKELQGKITSYKSLFIEWCQKNQKKYEYLSFEDTGNSRYKHFGVKLIVNEVVVGKARAKSKKEAEEIASRRAYYKFQTRFD
ncbi:MAG TPA: ribonuclease III [Lutibacter sp.]|nr:ribonuclease III [Lutibacter sp.]